MSLLTLNNSGMQLLRILPLILCFFCPLSAEAVESLHGINRVRIVWKQEQERRQILDEMAKAGVKTARMTLTPPFEQSLDAIVLANEEGMSVLIAVGLGSKPYYADHKGSLRTSYGRTWNAPRISMLDEELFHRSIRESFAALDAAKVTLAGIEVGNELNWAHFNGDLIIYPNPNTPVAVSIDALQRRDDFLKGLDKYIEVLRIVREEAKATKYNKDTPIISAGLASIDQAFADRRGYEYVATNAFIKELQKRGMDELVDAYGIHTYPPMDTGPAGRKKAMDKALSICAAPSEGKPCWLTEWGLRNNQETCPLDDAKRAQAAREVMSWLEDYEKKRALDAAYYYDWDRDETLSVWRCGGLSETGKVVIGVTR